MEGCSRFGRHQTIATGEWRARCSCVHRCLRLMVATAPISCRCGNVAAIFEYEGGMQHNFKFFSAADDAERGTPIREAPPDYFL
mmetsp:Transcript_22241/g.66836  ORF Transcript_22241/g.66836 Transcript_22241/m.66836 type:complete len:84 (+) Transcript_22241:1340-1591(+)